MNIPYKIIYSRRRTLALQINDQAELIVKAPLKYPITVIENFIQKKQSWIIKHMQKQEKMGVKAKEFVEDELFWFLGNQYPLRITQGYSSKLQFQDAFFISKFKLPFAKKMFIGWYAEQSKVIISERLKLHSATMGTQYKFGKITGANTRWGSCSGKNTVNFTWKLIMAPLEVIDYVVIHELAHTVHKNHSQKFWHFVSQFDPLFKTHKKWLNENGHLLKI